MRLTPRRSVEVMRNRTPAKTIEDRDEPVTIVVATNNAHKVNEIRSALEIEDIRFVPIGEVIKGWESPIEDADTFEGNAFIKADAVHRATGLPALADDSGLIVDVLGGDPGVHSSSYGGVEGDDARNNERLLRELADVTSEDRRARFTSTLVLVGLDEHIEHAPTYLTTQGSVEGWIAQTPRGDAGFGYDPLFMPDETPGKSMAELSMDEKNAISHRGRALAALAQKL